MIIEIRPGEGGEDALRFANELAGAVRAFARRNNDTTTEHSCGASRAVVLGVDGSPATYRFLAGVHRIQRVPANDRRRHTSTATLVVLEAATSHVVTVDPGDCRVEPYRGSGKGGQHRNKNATAARVTHLPSGIVVEAEEQRSFEQNRRGALRRIEERLRSEQATAAVATLRSERNAQVASAERPAKTWTHTEYRGEVICHETGEHWPLEAFRRGRLSSAA